MSYHHAEYVIASNNSINENQLNAKRAKSSKYQLKQLLLKPLLALVRKHKTTSYSKKKRVEEEEEEVADNVANELLEAQILDEIDSCEHFAGVPVFTNGAMSILPVCRGQTFIPVHFAKTPAGTFFWTSMAGADCDIAEHGDRNAITHSQRPELQAAFCDRWAQA